MTGKSGGKSKKELQEMVCLSSTGDVSKQPKSKRFDGPFKGTFAFDFSKFCLGLAFLASSKFFFNHSSKQNDLVRVAF